MVDTGGVQVRPLAIDGAFEFTPVQHEDDRGTFLEWFKSDVVRAVTGRSFDLAQANCSVSAAGVLRGIHFSDVPPGQAKYVTCLRGAAFDVVVDIRVGSPTFGQWDSVLLDDVNRRQVFITEGLGHAFMALDDDTTVLYLCSTPYEPEREHVIDALDVEIGISWPTTGRSGRPVVPIMSVRDGAAPTLETAAATASLPVESAVQRFIAGLA